MEQTSKATIQVYCAGGTGVNIGRFLVGDETGSKGFANLSLNFIDTSMSNFSPADRIDPKQIMIIDKADGSDIDGSGQVRNEHAMDIMENVGQILQRFKPSTNLNIVISSASGGSGSVIAPSIVSEILARGERVIAFTIGCQSTGKFATNTLGTIMSYLNIANARKEVVPFYYRENGKDGNEAQVDQDVIMTISMLRALYSGENLRLDRSDLRNWLGYNNVTSHEPSLSLLSIISKSTKPTEDVEYCSVATLTTVGMDATFPGTSLEYQCTGFVSGDVEQVVIDTLPVHLALSTAGIRELVNELKATVQTFEERKNSRRRMEIDIVGTQTNVLGNGLVI